MPWLPPLDNSTTTQCVPASPQLAGKHAIENLRAALNGNYRGHFSFGWYDEGSSKSQKFSNESNDVFLERMARHFVLYPDNWAGCCCADSHSPPGRYYTRCGYGFEASSRRNRVASRLCVRTADRVARRHYSRAHRARYSSGGRVLGRAIRGARQIGERAINR